jgi:hypothetical protein
MDHTPQRLRCASQLGIILAALGAAAENARDARLSKIVAELENLREDVIKLHRDVLELPPQSSTALAQLQDELPF